MDERMVDDLWLLFSSGDAEIALTASVAWLGTINGEQRRVQ